MHASLKWWLPLVSALLFWCSFHPVNIGPLGYVAARGVRLPAGKHRISIEKPGYFPWDRLVDASTRPIKLDVELEPIPD